MIQFTESNISAGASSQSFQRGSSYYRDGAVLELVQRGDVLSALVEGSSYDPYEVRVTLAGEGRLASAMCSCPYDFGGYCKHVVAVLLAALHLGETVTVKPPLEVQLAGLSEAQLRRVILAVAADQPGLVEAIEQEINWLTTMPAGETSGVAPAAPLIAVDLAAIRREMRKDFDRINSVGGGDYSRHYWDYDEAGQFSPDDVLEPHRTLALRLLDAGDAAAATDVICAMIDEWGEGTDGLDEWIIEGNEDVLSEAAQELDTLLAEALPSQDLSEEQRDWWLERISDWEDSSQFEIAASGARAMVGLSAAGGRHGGQLR
ncbi:MAG: SWIM zinc finger family protein [Anaerolineae bacterium]|nr:SWIM zinc finger family protein [Anaerolineae bacterium]